MTTGERLAAGAIAGFAATAPMTFVMDRLYRRLRAAGWSALPPRIVTRQAAEAVGAHRELSSRELNGLTLLAHFGYGAACGAAYAALTPRSPVPHPVGAVGWGLAVWAGSYLGWLPAVGLHPSATREPRDRNGLMIAAHIVWGAATGALLEAFERSRSASRVMPP
jgi:hypothetical protein